MAVGAWFTMYCDTNTYREDDKTLNTHGLQCRDGNQFGSDTAAIPCLAYVVCASNPPSRTDSTMSNDHVNGQEYRDEATVTYDNPVNDTCQLTC